MATPYTIKQGDTLSALAAQNKTDLPTLLKLNPDIKDPNLIRAGASLNLPDAPAPSPVISQLSSTPSVVTSDPIRNQELATQNQQQQQDQEEEQQLLRLQRKKSIQDLQTIVAPEKPDLVTTFNQLRNDQGIAGLETSLTDIRKQKLELKNQLNEFEHRTSGQGRTQGEVDTAVGVESKKLQEQYDRLTTEESSLVDQLNTKNSVIETIINLTGKDYDNAHQEYNDKFSQALQTINTIKGIQDADKTTEERNQDNARANLQILANQLSSGDLQFSQLDPAQQAQINKLELQAGLPTGTIASIKDNNPKADIVSTSTRTDAAGNKYADIVLKDKTTGQLKVEHQLLGRDTGGSSSDNLRSAKAAGVAKARPALEAVIKTSSDHYTDPALYQSLRLDFVEAFGTPDAFDNAFAMLLSPQERARLGVGKAAGVQADESNANIF